MQVVVCSKNKILLILVLFINTTISFSSSAKADVKVEKIDKVINWDDTDFYRDADINIQLAKQIKQERKRRVELKNKGYSNKEISRILKEEKNKNNQNFSYNNKDATNQKLSNKKHNKDKDNNKEINIDDLQYEKDNNEGVDDVDDGDDNEDEEEYVLVRKKKKNGKIINKKSKAYLVDEKEDNNNANVDRQRPKQNDEVKIISGKPNIEKKNRNNGKNQKHRNNFNIVPEIPKLPSESAIQNHSHYSINNANFNNLAYKNETTIHNNDKLTALSRQLVNLVGKNGDAEDIYMIKKMAEKNAFDYYNNKMDNRIYIDNKTSQSSMDEDMYGSNDDYKNNRTINKIKKPVNKNNSKSSSRFYAYTRPDAKKILADMEKNNQKAKTGQSETEEDDEIDITDYEKHITTKQQNDEIEIVKNKYTEGQLIAKQIGAPQPVFRTKKNYNTQISPQNISQVKYDKNNQHLDPTMFQSQIINDVFANLGSDNATEIARALINQVGKVDVIDADGNSLLMHSIARKNQSLTAMLLSEGANPNLLNKDGFSPLHLASTNGDDIAIYYLMMAGGDPNLRDGDGNTSFMYASMTCNQQTLQMMISMGANLNAINFANKNQSVLDYAKMNTNHPDVYQFLNNKIHQTKFVKSKDLNSE